MLINTINTEHLLDLTAFVAFLNTSLLSLMLDDMVFKWKSKNCLLFYKINDVNLVNI